MLTPWQDDVHRERAGARGKLNSASMPRRSGFEVLAWLRQAQGLPRLPVVILNSSRQPVDVDQAYALGANSYLVKPLGSHDLLVLVKAVHQYWVVLNTPPGLPAGT